MRNKLFTFIVVLCAVTFAAAGAFAASDGPRVRAHVPFGFHAGDIDLPKGDYIFELGNRVVISKADGSDSYFFSATIGSPSQSDKLKIEFVRYGDEYFLNTIHNGQSETTLTKSDHEKKMAAMNSKPVHVAVVKELK